MARAVVQKAIHNQNELDDLASMLINAVRSPPPQRGNCGCRGQLERCVEEGAPLSSLGSCGRLPVLNGFGHCPMVVCC